MTVRHDRAWWHAVGWVVAHSYFGVKGFAMHSPSRSVGWSLDNLSRLLHDRISIKSNVVVQIWRRADFLCHMPRRKVGQLLIMRPLSLSCAWTLLKIVAYNIGSCLLNLKMALDFEVVLRNFVVRNEFFDRFHVDFPGLLLNPDLVHPWTIIVDLLIRFRYEWVRVVRSNECADFSSFFIILYLR